VITSGGNRNPANADRSAFGCAARRRRIHPASYGNNRIEADYARLRARLRPMRGLKRLRSAARIAAGHAFIQYLRRGHYELATDVPPPPLRLATAFSELELACDHLFSQTERLPCRAERSRPDIR
jgi:hypothetical protein